MVSKSTKSIASRIPIDLYFQLKNEADELDLNMKDYLLKIIEQRNEKQKIEPEVLVETKEVNLPKVPKQIKKKPQKPEASSGSLNLFDFIEND